MSNFDWSADLEATNKQLDKAIKECDNNEDFSLVSQIAQEIASDDEDDSERIIRAYRNASAEERHVIDCILVWITGWSIKTLLDHAGIPAE